MTPEFTGEAKGSEREQGTARAAYTKLHRKIPGFRKRRRLGRIRNRWGQTSEKVKDFDESKHPRDPAGKFSEGSGGEGADSDGGNGEHPGKGYSASAYVENGVIHTSSVYDAQRALSENRKVELNQPRSLSVLIQRLGEVSKKMIAAGEEAPVFNLCNVYIKGTTCSAPTPRAFHVWRCTATISRRKTSAHT